MNNKKQIAKYIFFDLVGSALAWVVLNLYRKYSIESQIFGYSIPFNTNATFWSGLVVCTLFWIALFFFAGFYNRPYSKSRLKELSQSVGFTVFGAIILFFILILDDYVGSYKAYYKILSVLIISEFILTYIPRLLITSKTARLIHSGKIGFPTLIVGNGTRATEFIEDLNLQQKSQGYKIVGCVAVSRPNEGISPNIPRLGSVNEIKGIISSNKIKEVILATDACDNNQMTTIINELIPLNINLHALPNLYDILSGQVKMSAILNAPLIDISQETMPYWQILIKRTADYLVSAIALLVFAIPSAIIAIIIKMTSKGPIIYKQERIGRYGEPFMIYKFRSMCVNSEENGPLLSSKADKRITPIGHFMRKTHVDEIPNFYNVLKGDMSLVGPRPERQFFIDQIMKVAPHYIHLQKLRPGITSWGQVKFGYAENVEQMVKRLRYDMLYLENMSPFVDLKIITYTVITIFKGKGV